MRNNRKETNTLERKLRHKWCHYKKKHQVYLGVTDTVIVYIDDYGRCETDFI